MKYYSEELKSLFNSEEELKAAEEAEKAKQDNKEQVLIEITELFDKACRNIETVIEKLTTIEDVLTPKEEAKLLQELFSKMPKFMQWLSL